MENSIRDPALKEKLRPSYRVACKRSIMSPDDHEKVQYSCIEVITERIDGVEAEGVRPKASGRSATSCNC